jgi:phenylacetate-coenzyme A ligase PaaK-like adenylate-forming protein
MPRDAALSVDSGAPLRAPRTGTVQKIAQKLKTLRLGDVAIRRNPLFYSEACEVIRFLERADIGGRRAWTRARLARALSAAARLPYGRGVRGSDDIGAWPLLDKAMVRAEPQAFRAPGIFPAARASTGGTSGAPLPLARSLRSIVFEQACIDRMMALLGADPTRARIAVLRGDNVKDPSDFRPPYWSFAAGGRRMVLSSNHLNAATVREYAEALEAFAPDVLWAYPTSIESLCLLLERSGRELAVARVLTSSEVLRPEVWGLVTRTLGCELLDYYGQAERVGFAWARAPGEYRFLPGYAHIELLPTGDGRCEIAGTTLWNGAMPLVRYRTGDLVPLPEACGAREIEELALGVRPFAGVLGRDSDILISPEGVRLTGIDHFQRDVPNLVRIQVIQESLEHVRVLTLATRDFDASDGERLLYNIRRKLPASMRVDIERTDALERTAQYKAPFVIHRPAVRELLRP